MAVIETLYSVGDVVWHAGTTMETRQHPCPDCKDTRKWSAVSPAGYEYTFACPRCAASYSSFDKLSLKYQAHTPSVQRMTIGSVRFDSHSSRNVAEYMCLETGVGSGSIYGEGTLFRTEEEALAAADLIAKRLNVEVKHIVDRYNQTLSISDYQLESALLRKAKDAESAARSLLWNLNCLFSDIEDAEDKEAILEAISDYRRRDWESDKERAASVDTRPEGGDGTEIAAPFTSGAVAKPDARRPIA